MSDQTQRAMQTQPKFTHIENFRDEYGVTVGALRQFVEYSARLAKIPSQALCEICHKEDVQREDLGHTALGRERSRRPLGSTRGLRSAEPLKFRDSQVTRQE